MSTDQSSINRWCYVVWSTICKWKITGNKGLQGILIIFLLSLVIDLRSSWHLYYAVIVLKSDDNLDQWTSYKGVNETHKEWYLTMSIKNITNLSKSLSNKELLVNQSSSSWKTSSIIIFLISFLVICEKEMQSMFWSTEWPYSCVEHKNLPKANLLYTLKKLFGLLTLR